MSWGMANVGTFMPLGKLLVELMSHREDNVPQHVSGLIKLVTLLTCELLIFYYTKSTAPQKPIYFLAKLMLDWILAYQDGTNNSPFSQHTEFFDEIKSNVSSKS